MYVRPFLQRLRARKASLAELQAIHSENHVRLYGRPSLRKPGQERKGMAVMANGRGLDYPCSFLHLLPPLLPLSSPLLHISPPTAFLSFVCPSPSFLPSLPSSLPPPPLLHSLQIWDDPSFSSPVAEQE